MSNVMIAWDSVRDSDTLPDNLYHVRIESFELDNWDDGRLIAKMRATVLAPNDCEGSAYFQRFFLGTSEDPDFEDPATHGKSFSLRLVKQCIKSTGVTPANSLADTLRLLEGTEVLLVNKVENDFNNVKKFFAVGEKTVGAPAGRAASSRPRITNGSGAHAQQPEQSGQTAGRAGQFAVVEE